MRKSNSLLSAVAFSIVGIILFASCQEGIDAPEVDAHSSSESVVDILQSDQKIEYLVKNFDQEMDQETVTSLVEAYDRLTYEELNQFYDLEAQYSVEQGADSVTAFFTRDYRQAVNQRGYLLYELTAANLSEEQLEVATREVQNYPRFAEAIKQVGAAPNNARRVTLCSGKITWDRNPNIRVEPQVNYPTAFSYSTVGFSGQYTFCTPEPNSACSTDCDLVFFSLYNGTSPQIVWASTAKARKVLTWRGTNSLDTYYGRTDDGSNYVLIGIGLGRLNYYYIDPLTGATATSTFVDVAQSFASRLYVGSL
jgi:hypothetical protein